MSSPVAERASHLVAAVSLPLGVVLLALAELLHPSREDPNDHPAVFAEYAQSDSWIAVHLAQFFAVLLVIGGLIALHGSLREGSGAVRVVARLAVASAVATAAAFTVLQAVDGVALKRAVDVWIAGLIAWIFFLVWILAVALSSWSKSRETTPRQRSTPEGATTPLL
jgi:hypothetical protein